MPKTKPSIYPEAKNGPLGTNHAGYAAPRKFAGKSESINLNRLIIVGILLIAGGILTIIWFISTVGAPYF